MLELFPEGFEEVERPDGRRARRLHGRRAASGRLRDGVPGARRGRRRATTGTSAGASSTSGVVVGAALGRAAVGGAAAPARSPSSSTRAGVRHRRARRRRGSASSCSQSIRAAACSTSGCGSGVLAIAAREARLRAGDRARRRPGRGRGDRARTRAANGVERRRPRSLDALAERCRPPTSSVANIALGDGRVARLPLRVRAARDHVRLPRGRGRPSLPGLPRSVDAARARRLGGRPLDRTGRSISRRWRPSRSRFLGCKVSHTDAQAVRERPAARRARRDAPAPPTSPS